MPSILFVCIRNAGRSQMADSLREKRGLFASSAGTLPSSRVNPILMEAKKEKGIGPSANTHKLLTAEMIERASLIITKGCSGGEICPRPILAKMQKKLLDWHLADPKGKPLVEVMKIRDEIERNVIQLSKAL